MGHTSVQTVERTEMGHTSVQTVERLCAIVVVRSLRWHFEHADWCIQLPAFAQQPTAWLRHG